MFRKIEGLFVPIGSRPLTSLSSRGHHSALPKQMASGADKSEMLISLSSVSWKSSQFSRELHFVTKLLPQVWLCLRLLTRTCIK